MTVYHKTLLFVGAVGLSALAASSYLLFEIRRGVPFAFNVNAAIVLTLTLLLPLVSVALVQRYTPLKQPLIGWLVFYGVCLAVILVFGLGAF